MCGSPALPTPGERAPVLQQPRARGCYGAHWHQIPETRGSRVSEGWPWPRASRAGSVPPNPLCWPRHPQSTGAPLWAQPNAVSSDFHPLCAPIPFPGQPSALHRCPSALPCAEPVAAVRPTPSRLTGITNISPGESKSQIQQPLNQHSNPSELAFGGYLANHLPLNACTCYMPSHDTLLKACCVCPYTFIKSLFSPSALGVACLLFSLHGEFSLTLAGECLCVCNQKKWERKCSKIDSGAQSTEMPKCISNSIPWLQPRLCPHTVENTASSAPYLPFTKTAPASQRC